MEIRKIKPHENVHRNLMCSVCFGLTSTEDRYAWLQEPEKHTSGYENVLGAFVDGKIISGMAVHPATIMVNGIPTKAGLIGGVTTLPEYRNTGCVRKMFEFTMPIMKEEGMVYSLLYPFSAPFYRKFGYEQTFLRQSTCFPMSELSRFAYPDGVRVFDKGGDWKDFAQIYNTFASGRNMAMVRGKAEWDKIMNRDPHKNKAFSYIHYDTDNKPDAYVLYNCVHKKDDEFLMHIHELAWVNTAGLHAMLGFVYGLRSEYNEVKWIVPEGMDIYSLVDNPRSVSRTVDNIVMTRVLDVPAALNMITPPPGPRLGAGVYENGYGEVIISVTDKNLPPNSGVYKIMWGDNGLHASKVTFYDSIDMELDAETLAQLLIGYLTPDYAQHRSNVIIHGKHNELNAVFPKKNIYLRETF